MKPARQQQLRQRGWSESQVKHAEEVLERAEYHDLFFSKIVFWSALVVVIFANIIVSAVLIPFLLAFTDTVLYATVVILAATIGFLYTFLVTDIGHLHKAHHRAAGILVPLIAVVNVAAMVFISNRFITELQLQNQPHDPILVSIIFVIAFLVPYMVVQLRELVRK